jgi:hypothetical protein
MHKLDIVAATFRILSLLFLAPPATYGLCLVQDNIFAPPNFLPIISNNVCAMPPGTIATDGCDDVCLLTKCCKNWERTGSHEKITLPNKNMVDCSTVNCGNICRMACERESTGEACTCDNLKSDGKVYVFGRDGFCYPPLINPLSPTHVGFGFQVAPHLYLFGSVENGGGCARVPAGQDNGFWMATGSSGEMLATFRNPSNSGLHGTIYPGKVPPYDHYKASTVKQPKVGDAVKAAENLYNIGYNVTGNNCLNAVYNILLTYGAVFPKDINPETKWCPSGSSSKSSFFGALSGGNWSPPKPIPTTGSPVKAVAGCPTTIPHSCAGAISPPSGGSSGSCGGADFTHCSPCGSLGPTCFVAALDPAKCPTSCANVNPCVCKGACSQGSFCYSWIRG